MRSGPAARAAGRAARSAASPPAARAPRPAIIPRTQWGGDGVPPRSGPAYGQVQLAFVHHTVNANDYGPEDSAAIVLGIAKYHRDHNGWNDVGYNFVVDQYGQIFEGRAGGDRPGDRRRAGAGLQQRLDRHRVPRHVHGRRPDARPAWTPWHG